MPLARETGEGIRRKVHGFAHNPGGRFQFVVGNWKRLFWKLRFHFAAFTGETPVLRLPSDRPSSAEAERDGRLLFDNSCLTRRPDACAEDFSAQASAANSNRTSNERRAVQRPTSNFERGNGALKFDVGSSTFDVRRSHFFLKHSPLFTLQEKPVKPMTPRKMFAGIAVFLCFWIAIVAVATSAFGMASKPSSDDIVNLANQVQQVSNQVKAATTQPIVQLVAPEVPYGSLAVTGVAGLATIVGLGAGLVKSLLTGGTLKSAIAEIIPDIATYVEPSTPYSPATQAVVNSIAGIAAAAPVPTPPTPATPVASTLAAAPGTTGVSAKV
jgi:hypothetical protein